MSDIYKKKLNEYAKAAEGFINSYLGDYENVPKGLSESMSYSIKAGGKRIRPALLLGTYDIFSGEPMAKAIPYAASLEMIHTYSLIHDDLPSMDNDDLRRGKPSNHIVFGEAGAILAGDALLNSAVEIIFSDLLENADAGRIRAASYILSASGPKGMIGGQVLDINGAADARTLSEMHAKKTGALINAAVAAGGILGGCGTSDEKALLDFSDNLGCAFQIKDDILDVEGAEDMIGKPTGSDSRNSKVTYTSLYGLDSSKKMLFEYIDRALKALRIIDGDTGFLEYIATYIRDRKD